MDLELIVKLESLENLVGKSMHGAIWYISTDMLEDKYYERFMFVHNGFMEILLGKDTEIGACFSLQKRAEKFKIALEKTLKKILKKKS